MNPKSEIQKLRAELERHNQLYYAGEPEISDFDFDQMLRRLQELEAKHPEFSDPNSSDEDRLSKYVDAFFANDPQAPV